MYDTCDGQDKKSSIKNITEKDTTTMRYYIAEEIGFFFWSHFTKAGRFAAKMAREEKKLYK